MFRSIFQFVILILVWWTANGISGFHKGISLIHREPTFADYTRSTKTVNLEYIEQRLDNFDSTNNATWKMRYYRNDEYFKYGSPIIIFIGGEWVISPEILVSGRIYELAKDFDAQLFYTEHRYYGESYPTPDASTENLQYLSIEQSMADLAYFIVEKKKEAGKENSPVILVGGSYSATMATWFMQIYPDLAAGAWSSSAPLFTKVDFKEYKEISGAAIRHLGGEKCYQTTKSAIDQGEAMIQDGRIEELKEIFDVCDSFSGDNILDTWLMFLSMSNAWSVFVQYHDNNTIQLACEALINLAETPNTTIPQAYGRWVKQVLSFTDCMEFNYNEAIEYIKNVNWSLDWSRQWLYQVCSQLGWYHSSTSTFHPFGSLFPADMQYQLCEDLFGLNRQAVDEAVQRTNEKYGGYNPNVENVFFTHGEVDPWRILGIQQTQSELSPVVIIPEASHGQDLQEMKPGDNQEMRAAKLKIKHLIEEWIEKK